MMNGVMTGDQKLEFLRSQIIEIRTGLRSFILCPYCGSENTPVDETLCCKIFKEASEAVLDRIEKQEAIDFLSAVHDRVN